MAWLCACTHVVTDVAPHNNQLVHAWTRVRCCVCHKASSSGSYWTSACRKVRQHAYPILGVHAAVNSLTLQLSLGLCSIPRASEASLDQTPRHLMFAPANTHLSVGMLRALHTFPLWDNTWWKKQVTESRGEWTSQCKDGWMDARRRRRKAGVVEHRLNTGSSEKMYG